MQSDQSPPRREDTPIGQQTTASTHPALNSHPKFPQADRKSLERQASSQANMSVASPPHQPLPGIHSLLNFGSINDHPPPARPSHEYSRSNSSSPATYQMGTAAHSRSAHSVDSVAFELRQDPFRPQTPSTLSPQYMRMARPSLSTDNTHLYRSDAQPPRPLGSESQFPTQNPQTTHSADHRARGSSSSLGDRNDRSSRASSSTSGHRPVHVSTKHVPGKGMCYIFSDGSSIPTEANGEPVNPDLGVTKQNKARKRQAHACLHCREKKIKCEIDPARGGPCQACSKTGRECQWSNGARPSPDGPSKIELGGAKRRYDSRDSSPTARVNPVAAAPLPPSAVSETAAHSNLDLEPVRSFKRPKSPSYEQSRNPLLGLPSYASLNAVCDTSYQFGASPIALNEDPYRIKPAATLRLLDAYFTYRDRACTKVLPRASFMSWVQTNEQKSRDELLALKSCMAVGAIYCPEPELKALGAAMMESAKQLDADIMNGVAAFTLCLPLARLNMEIYQWSIGKISRAFELTGTACRALSALRLNTEQGCRDVSQDPTSNDFGLSANEAAESRRRTFWMGYLVERNHSTGFGHTGMLPDADITVNLPNLEADYEAGRPTVGVSFNEGDFTTDGAGEMALFVSVKALQGQTVLGIMRELRRDPELYAHRYEAHYQIVSDRLAAWERSLPQHLKPSVGNARLAIQGGYFATYFSLMACYRCTSMTLNRWCRFSSLSATRISRNINLARHHATEFLEVIAIVSKLDPKVYRQPNVSNAVRQAFSGWAIQATCDVLSSGGPPEDFTTSYALVGSAEGIIDDVSKVFKTCMETRAVIRGRMSDFGAETMIDSRRGKPWRFDNSILKSFVPRDWDVIYGVPKGIFHDAIAQGMGGRG